MKNAYFLILLACCFSGWPFGQKTSACFADVFTLRSGEVVDGKVFRETDETYMVLIKHLDGQKMVTIKKRDVLSRSESVKAEELIVGVININPKAMPAPSDTAATLIECLERSLGQGDDLTFVILDDLSLDAAGAILVSGSMARAVRNGDKSRLVGVIGNCRGASAVIASCFSTIVTLPHARLEGPGSGVFDADQSQRIREYALLCHEPNSSLVDALVSVQDVWHQPRSGWRSSKAMTGTQFSPRGGRLSLSKDQMLETKTAVVGCQSIDEVPLCLGHSNVSIREVRPRVQRGTQGNLPTGLAALIPRRISDFNKGLAKAKEGIEILRRTSSGQWLGWQNSYWRVNIKKYWERDHGRGIIPNSIKKISGNAQRLVKSGLKKAIDCAQFLEKQAKHQNDPRLLEASSRIKTMLALEGAVENEIQQGFESKCDAVLNMSPLSAR